MSQLAAVILCLTAQHQPELVARADPHVEVQAKQITIQAQGQPEGRNAYETLLQIRSLVQKTDQKKDGDTRVIFYALLRPEWAKPGQVEKARRVLADLRAAGIERLITDASECPRLVRPVSMGLAIDNKALDLSPLRDAINIELVLAREDLAASNMTNWLGRIERSLRLSRLLLADSLIIGYTSGALESQVSLEEAAIAVDSGRLSTADLHRLREIVREFGPVPHATKCLEADRLMAVDTIEWMYEADSKRRYRYVRGDGEMPVASASEPRSNDPPLPGWATRAEVLAKVNEVYDNAKRLGAMPCGQRDLDPFDFRPTDDHNGKYAAIAAIMPSVLKTFVNTDQADLVYFGLDSMIALELYRAEHQRYPETLEELVPALLPAVPVDPFSGVKLQYGPAPSAKVFPGNRPYVLYALGRDGKDDNGHIDPDHPWAATAPNAKGFDIMLNPARAAR